MSIMQRMTNYFAETGSVKRVWCWVVGHQHQESGDFSLCWRCGEVKHANEIEGKQ